MNILIADDHPIVRQGLVRIVEQSNNFHVIGEADDGEIALRLIEERAPHIAIMDLSMPKIKGLDVIRIANERDYPVEFIVLTMFKEEEYFNEAMDLGVKGYVLKESAVNDLHACLVEVAEGRYYVSPLVSNFLMKRSARIKALFDRDPVQRELTVTERQVLKYIAQNKTSKEIADCLHISYRTVQKHRTNICEKLGLQGYNKLLEYAFEHRAMF